MKKSIISILVISLTSITSFAQSRVSESISASTASRQAAKDETLKKFVTAQKNLERLKTELELIDNSGRKTAQTVKAVSLIAAATSVIIAVYAWKDANTALTFQRAESMGYLTFYSSVAALFSGVTAGGAYTAEVLLTPDQVKDLLNQIDETNKEIRALKAEYRKLK